MSMSTTHRGVYRRSNVGHPPPPSQLCAAGNRPPWAASQGTTSTALTSQPSKNPHGDAQYHEHFDHRPNASDFTKGRRLAVQAWPPRRLVRLMLRSHPSAAAARSASLTLVDNAAGRARTRSRFPAPAQAAATPSVSLTPSPLDIGNQQINTTSATQVITLKNTGSGILTIGGITHHGRLWQTNACGASLWRGPKLQYQCEAQRPPPVGAKTGTISVSDNPAGSPHAVSLSGTGVAAAVPAITLTPNTGLAFSAMSQWAFSASPAQTVTLKNTG